MTLTKTPAQEEAIQQLISQIDNFEEAIDQHTGEITFAGDGSDGPVCGYISTYGTVDWLVGPSTS